MSPRELSREFDAASERYRIEADRDTVLAWRIAALSRMEKLPKLEEMLVSVPKRRQTPAEQREVLKILSKRYQIPLREVVH